MKLKKYREILEKDDITLKGYNSDDADDDLFGRPNHSSKEDKKEDKKEEPSTFGKHVLDDEAHYFGDEDEESLYAISDGSDDIDYDGEVVLPVGLTWHGIYGLYTENMFCFIFGPPKIAHQELSILYWQNSIKNSRIK